MEPRPGQGIIRDKNSPKRLGNIQLGNWWIHRTGPGDNYLGPSSNQGHKVDHKELWRQNQDEEDVEDKKKLIGKYSAVMYTPLPVENDAAGYDSKPSTSMAQLQEKLEHEINILTKESRKED